MIETYNEDTTQTTTFSILATESLQDISSSRHIVLKTICLEDVFKTYLEDVLKTCLEEVLKKCLEDVLKACLEDVLKILWRQTKYLLEISVYLSGDSKS